MHQWSSQQYAPRRVHLGLPPNQSSLRHVHSHAPPACLPPLLQPATPHPNQHQPKLQRPRPFIVDTNHGQLPQEGLGHGNGAGAQARTGNVCQGSAPRIALPADPSSQATQLREQQEAGTTLQHGRQRRFRHRSSHLRRQAGKPSPIPSYLDAAAAALMSGVTDPDVVVPLLAVGTGPTPASEVLKGHVELMAACANVGVRLPGSVMVPWGEILLLLLPPSFQQQDQQLQADRQRQSQPHHKPQHGQQAADRLQDGHPQALWLAHFQQQQQGHEAQVCLGVGKNTQQPPLLPPQRPMQQPTTPCSTSQYFPPLSHAPPQRHSLTAAALPSNGSNLHPTSCGIGVTSTSFATAVHPTGSNVTSTGQNLELRPPASVQFRNSSSPPLLSSGSRACIALRVLEACSSLGHHLGHPTMEAIMACLHPCWDDLLPHQLVSCLRALSHLDYFPQQPPNWLEGALAAVLVQLPHFNASQVCAVLRSLAQLDTNNWATSRHTYTQAVLMRTLASQSDLHPEIIDLLPPINTQALRPALMPRPSDDPSLNHSPAGNTTRTLRLIPSVQQRRVPMHHNLCRRPYAHTHHHHQQQQRRHLQEQLCHRGHRRRLLLPTSGTRARPLQRRMQERDVRLGLWLLTHMKVPASEPWLRALLQGAARRARVLSPAALVATFQVMAVYRSMPPFAARHRLWVWVKQRWCTLGSSHSSSLLTWALKAGTQPPTSLLVAVVDAMQGEGVACMQAHAVGRLLHRGPHRRTPVRAVMRLLWVLWSTKQPLTEPQTQAICALLAQRLCQHAASSWAGSSQGVHDSEIALALWSLANCAALSPATRGHEGPVMPPGSGKASQPCAQEVSRSSSSKSHSSIQATHPAHSLASGRELVQAALCSVIPNLLPRQQEQQPQQQQTQQQQEQTGGLRAGDAVRIVHAAKMLQLHLPLEKVASLLSYACVNAMDQACAMLHAEPALPGIAERQARALQHQEHKNAQDQQQQQLEEQVQIKLQQQQRHLKPAEVLLLLRSIAQLPDDVLSGVLRSLPSALKAPFANTHASSITTAFTAGDAGCENTGIFKPTPSSSSTSSSNSHCELLYAVSNSAVPFQQRRFLQQQQVLRPEQEQQPQHTRAQVVSQASTAASPSLPNDFSTTSSTTLHGKLHGAWKQPHETGVPAMRTEGQRSSAAQPPAAPRMAMPGNGNSTNSNQCHDGHRSKAAAKSSSAAYRWSTLAQSLPSLAALCQAVPPSTMARACGDIQFVDDLACLSKLRLQMGAHWLQACEAEVAGMLATRAPLPPASLVLLLQAAASLPLSIPPCLLEAALPGLLALPYQPAAGAQSSAGGSQDDIESSGSLGSKESARGGRAQAGPEEGTQTSRRRGSSSCSSSTLAGKQRDSGTQQAIQEQQQNHAQHQRHLGMAVSINDVVAVLWLCSKLRLRVPPLLLHAIHMAVHAHLHALSPGNLARAVLGLADIHGIQSTGVAHRDSAVYASMLGCSTGGGTANSLLGCSLGQDAHISGQHEAGAEGPVAEGGSSSSFPGALKLQSEELLGELMQAVLLVPTAAMQKAAQPGFEWGSRAKSRKGASGAGSRLKRSSVTTNKGGGVLKASDWEEGTGAGIARTVCAMTPDQLCSVLLGVAKWRQQQQDLSSYYLSQQPEWLEALLALVQTRTRGVISSHGLLRATSALLLLQHTPSKELLRAFKRRAWNLRRSKLMSPEDLQLFNQHYKLLQQQPPVINVTEASATPKAVIPALHLPAAPTTAMTASIPAPEAHAMAAGSLYSQVEQQQLQSSRTGLTTPLEREHSLMTTVTQLLRRLPIVQQDQQQLTQTNSAASSEGAVQLGQQGLSRTHAPQHSVYLQRLLRTFHTLAFRMLMGVSSSQDSSRGSGRSTSASGLLLLPVATSEQQAYQGASSCLSDSSTPCPQPGQAWPLLDTHTVFHDHQQHMQLTGSEGYSLESGGIAVGAQSDEQAGDSNLWASSEPLLLTSTPTAPSALACIGSSSSSSSCSTYPYKSMSIGSGSSWPLPYSGSTDSNNHARGGFAQFNRPMDMLTHMLQLKFRCTVSIAAQRGRQQLQMR